MMQIPNIPSNGGETRRLQTERVKDLRRSKRASETGVRARANSDRRHRNDRRLKRSRVRFERRSGMDRRRRVDITV